MNGKHTAYDADVVSSHEKLLKLSYIVGQLEIQFPNTVKHYFLPHLNFAIFFCRKFAEFQFGVFSS